MRTTLRYFALLATIASTSSFALAQDDATQAGRRQAEQSPLSTQSQPQSRAAEGQLGQPGQPRPGGLIQPGQPGARPAMQGAGMSVSQFLAHDLRRGNEAEVELGKLASEKAQHDQVKKFAQTMVEHHSQTIQQLQQLEQRGGAGQGAAGQGATRQRVGQSEPESRDDSAREDREVQDQAARDRDQDQAGRPGQGNIRRGTGNVRNSESGTDGVRSPQGAAAPGGASQATTTAGQVPGTNEPGTPPALAGQAVPGQAGAAGRPIPGQPGIAAGAMMSGQVPQQLAAVFDQAHDTELQMTKEMLQQHQGQDFDMGYIGQQIVAHTCMLAKLQAIKNSGPQELQQLATQGEQTTRQHLEMAKQIAQQIKDKGDSSSQPATRSASSSAKQPSSAEQEKK